MKKLVFILFIFPFFTKAQSIVAGDTISSGIVYKNIKDTLLPFIAKATSICDIDIDNDNVKDIRFSHEHNSSPGFALILKKVFSLSNLEFVLTSTNTYADSIAKDSVIDAFMNWQNIVAGQNLFYFYTSGSGSSQAGQFVKANNYLGFRKISAIDTIYGWFLLDMTSTIKIKSFAYEKKCNSTPSILVTSSSGVICSGETTTITASGASSFTWSTGGNATSIVVSPTVTTSYTVDGTNSVGCLKSSVITQTVNSCIGIKEWEILKIKIYPNPANEFLRILDENNVFQNSEIEILNYLGQTILKLPFINSIDILKLPQGIYSLKIVTKDNQNYYSKFVKE